MQIIPVSCMNNSLNVSFVFLWTMYILSFVANFSRCKKIVTDKLWNKTVIIKIGFYFIIPMTVSIDWLIEFSWCNPFPDTTQRKWCTSCCWTENSGTPALRTTTKSDCAPNLVITQHWVIKWSFLRLSRDIYFQVYYKYLLKLYHPC